MQQITFNKPVGLPVSLTKLKFSLDFLLLFDFFKNNLKPVNFFSLCCLGTLFQAIWAIAAHVLDVERLAEFHAGD